MITRFLILATPWRAYYAWLDAAHTPPPSQPCWRALRAPHVLQSWLRSLTSEHFGNVTHRNCYTLLAEPIQICADIQPCAISRGIDCQQYGATDDKKPAMRWFLAKTQIWQRFWCKIFFKLIEISKTRSKITMGAGDSGLAKRGRLCRTSPTPFSSELRTRET